MESPEYLDLDNGEREPFFFFLLNAYLQSRIETRNESDGDEEVNVYLAGLLCSLVDGRFYTCNLDRLAASPADVCQRVQTCGSDRAKAEVYRANADHRLVAFGLFSGWGDHVSLYRRATTPDEAHIEEAQQFYGWAALLCGRLPSRYRGLKVTLEKLADGFETYRHILAHMGANHLDLLQRLSPGEAYHLERAAHEAALPQIEGHALDRMLDAYNRWRAEPCDGTRTRFFQESLPYRQLRPGFDPGGLVN